MIREVRSKEPEMNHKIQDIGVSKNIGSYSDAIESASGLRWLHTSGTPGMTKFGDLPKDIEGQSRQVWANMIEILNQAGMTINDIVKVTTSLINAQDIPAYVRVRKEVLGDVKPAFMLSVVNQLIRPDVLVEVEIIAAKK
jgi:2-iminobutanoate/2-iminopropanoate deaminase